MPAKSQTRRWRKADASETVAALVKQQMVDRVSSALANSCDDFEVDVKGGSIPKAAAETLRQAERSKTLHLREMEAAENYAARRATLRAELAKREGKVFDLWGAGAPKARTAPPPPPLADVPAIVVPTDGYSANPEKGVWEDAVFEQAAVSRDYLEELGELISDDGTDSTEVEGGVDEKEEIEPVKVKTELDADDDQPAENESLLAYGTVARQCRRLQSFRRGQILQRKRQDLKRYTDVIAAVEREREQIAKTRQYHAHAASEEARLRKLGIVSRKAAKRGSSRLREIGQDVALPGHFARAQGSLRRVANPATGNVLRERVASFFKRGMIEAAEFEKPAPAPKRKLSVRVRMH